MLKIFIIKIIDLEISKKILETKNTKLNQMNKENHYKLYFYLIKLLLIVLNYRKIRLVKP